jgi:hypothetical protein
MKIKVHVENVRGPYKNESVSGPGRFMGGHVGDVVGTLTDEHSLSSYNIPVLLVNGEVSNIPVGCCISCAEKVDDSGHSRNFTEKEWDFVCRLPITLEYNVSRGE